MLKYFAQVNPPFFRRTLNANDLIENAVDVSGFRGIGFKILVLPGISFCAQIFLFPGPDIIEYVRRDGDF
jgi:hypothetical protein